MKVLVVLHGMPPQAGRAVVGAGLRAFANGEALRGRGHQVLYCTRAEDLPAEAREAATERRQKKPLLLTTITGEFHPPGDPRRMRRRLTAVGAAPTADDPDGVRAPSEPGPGDGPVTHPGVAAIGPGTGDGLAPVGGPLGAPGNPFSFTEAHELHEIVQRVDPDVVLVEALEEARRLPEGRFSVVLDLFAPRILEQQFQAADDEREAVRVLDAIQRGDAFVFSNERQKYFHLPLLALAGVDCTREAGAVVPISCPPELPERMAPPEPTFIAGGVFWPWADLSNGLASLLSILEARDAGRLHLYGGEYGIRSDTANYADPRASLPREHPRLSFRGLVPIDQLWDEYRRGSVAFDLMRPNPERELNLSFRQIDYLRCGLPIITSPRQVIAADLLEYGAGWVIEPGNTRALRRLVDGLLDEPAKIAAASAQAQALARDRYAWDQTIEPLDRLIRNPTRRKREETFVARLTRTQGDLWEEHEENQRLREALSHQRADLEKKTDEIAALNARIASLMGSVDRLSESLGEVSRFKNDAVAYLQEQTGEAIRDVGEAAVELERRSLDLRKKQDALTRAQAEIAKLKASVAELRTDNEHLEARFVARDREALGFEEDRKRAVTDADALRDKLAALKQDLDKKDSERTELTAAHAAELADLRERLDAAVAAGSTSAADADALRGELEELRASLSDATAAGSKKDRELRRLRELAARREGQHQHALEALQADALARLEVAEEAAARIAEQLRDGLARTEQERSRLAGRLAEARHRLADLEREGAARDRDIDALRRRAETEEARFQDELARQADRGAAALQELREAADERAAGLRRELETARAEAASAGDRLGAEKARVADLEADVAKKTAALAEAARERQRLEAGFLRSLEAAEVAAREVLERARDRIGSLEGERGALKARLDEVGQRAGDTQRELAAKDQALERLRRTLEQEQGRAEAGLLQLEQAADRRLRETKDAASDAVEAARTAAEEARRDRDTLAARLEQARGRLADLEADLAKKDGALKEAADERERLQAAFLAALEKAEHGARALVERSRDAAARLEAERATLRAELDEARARLRDLEREAESARAALARQQQAAQLELARLESAARQSEQQGDARLQQVRETAQAQIAEARAVTEEARLARDQVLTQLEKARSRIVDVEADLAKKSGALAEAQRDRDAAWSASEALRLALEADVLQAQQQRDAARVEVESELATLREERASLAGALERTTFERDALARDAEKKTAEV